MGGMGGQGKPPLEKHFRQVAESYGSVVAVDLIKQVSRREGGGRWNGGMKRAQVQAHVYVWFEHTCLEEETFIHVCAH